MQESDWSDWSKYRYLIGQIGQNEVCWLVRVQNRFGRIIYMFSSHDPQLSMVKHEWRIMEEGLVLILVIFSGLFGIDNMYLFRKGFQLKISTDLFNTVLNFPYETNWIKISHFSNCSIWSPSTVICAIGRCILRGNSQQGNIKEIERCKQEIELAQR